MTDDTERLISPWAQTVVIVLFYLATASEDIYLSAPHPPKPKPPSISAAEGDLDCLSVSSDDTGPISNTSCKLCISQMPHKPSSGWSVRHACFVQYANNHMQITYPCVWQYISVDVNAAHCSCVLAKDWKWLKASHQIQLQFAKSKGYQQQLWWLSASLVGKDVIATHMSVHTLKHTHRNTHANTHTHTGQKLWAASCCAATRDVLSTTQLQQQGWPSATRSCAAWLSV